jgi:selenocysteine synthase-like protein
MLRALSDVADILRPQYESQRRRNWMANIGARERRRIPSVDKAMQSAAAQVVAARFGHGVLVNAVRTALAAARASERGIDAEGAAAAPLTSHQPLRRQAPSMGWPVDGVASYRDQIRRA